MRINPAWAGRGGPWAANPIAPTGRPEPVATLSLVSVQDPWPPGLPRTESGTDPCIPVWSLPVEVDGFSGLVEGRTTGGCQQCRARSCGGWQIRVVWETGQVMHLCSRGWTYDPATRSIRITAGTGLSTTTATDRPNTRKPPPPRSEWPSRSLLGDSWNG